MVLIPIILMYIYSTDTSSEIEGHCFFFKYIIKNSVNFHIKLIAIFDNLDQFGLFTMQRKEKIHE